MTTTYVARTAAVAQTWIDYPNRLVTCSTGVVHIDVNGFTMCGTRVAVRTATKGITPTCRNCGADAAA